MRILIASATLSVVFAILAGCGGGGSGGGSGGGPIVAASPYTGTYSGMSYSPASVAGQPAWTDTVNLTIGSSGVINGTGVFSTGTNILTGSVSNSGSASITGASSTANAGDTGQFNVSSARTIQANLLQSGGGGNTFVILVKNPSPPVSTGMVFNGDYVGTVTNLSQNTTEIMALTIDPTGNISGGQLLVNGNSVTLGTDSGSALMNGTFSIPVAVNGSNFDTTTGSFVLDSGLTTVLRGTATNTNGDRETITLNQIQ